jgi:hypothetical protein
MALVSGGTDEGAPIQGELTCLSLLWTRWSFIDISFECGHQLVNLVNINA